MKVLLTGSSGFIGQHLTAYLLKRGVDVVAVSTRGDEWYEAMDGCDAVIHLAAYVHQECHDIDEMREVNVVGTQRIAEEAIKKGINRFIFLSTIKVLGEKTKKSYPFTEEMQPNPKNIYASTKLWAENVLLELALRHKDFEPVIIRTPLVYGEGVKANYKALLGLCSKSFSLPFAGNKTRRSMIYVENLCSAIFACLDDRRAARKVFLVKDDETWPLYELIRVIKIFMLKNAPSSFKGAEGGEKTAYQMIKNRHFRCGIFYFPNFLLYLGLMLLGRKSVANRLYTYLEVDDSLIHKTLNWYPEISTIEGIERSVEWFLADIKK
ncbi:MAG: NAD-dependent epimerase/dehydratase family protein [Alphaproteobacteria bacterium]